MTRFALVAAVAAIALPSVPAAAQTMKGMTMPAPAPSPTPTPQVGHEQMPNMPDMPGMAAEAPFAGGSGTSRLPGAEGMMQGIHANAGGWMLMAHGYVWGAYTDQPGPRGDDMAVVTSMAMLTGDRDLGGGARLQLRSMLSLDPLMGARGYPNLLTTGETAGGKPLVDRQHPHDLFMELAARVDVPVGGEDTLFVYGGPVAEPALGPSAFMHRGSAEYLPLAPITHHWFDSTHITYGVVTAGWSSRHVQFEASAFRGREPDEHRWDIETPKLDSWSVRATWTPSPNWALEVSHGRLESPEALHPGEDEARTIASVSYARDGIAATAGFSAKDRLPGRTLTAWFAEANWELGKHHTLFGRIENVANDELFPDPADPRHNRPFRVTRAEAGYAYRLPLGPFGLALGGALDAYGKPAALDAAYGDAPFGYTLFAKLSLGH